MASIWGITFFAGLKFLGGFSGTKSVDPKEARSTSDSTPSS